MKTKTVVTITGIRPDFIRMSAIFKKLDQEFRHVLIHTGQHYDDLLSGVFFRELEIRRPDYVLASGQKSSSHYEQLAYLSMEVIGLLRRENILPDLILFLGDSNSVCASLPLKKEGYRIGHIEAGMRSHDRRMLEEINRTVCDHCSDIFFVYHEDYRDNLRHENIAEQVHVVGNTIVEVCRQFIPNEPSRRDRVLLDVHRPENFNSRERLCAILDYANICAERYGLPVKMLRFPRTEARLREFDLEPQLRQVEPVDLMSYRDYLRELHHCRLLISDSGTAQEEPALLGTPVVVPRDFTERPQSVAANCSYMLKLEGPGAEENFRASFAWLDGWSVSDCDVSWLGDGRTSERVVEAIRKYLDNT
ncbi:MAG: UDP-N-acetyl glucosamine 2-epimerase [Sulfobacillus sp.]